MRRFTPSSAVTDRKLPMMTRSRRLSPEELEKIRTASAIRTDFILSAEIIAITYSTVADSTLTTQIAVLAAIGVGITLAVYGFVGLIVKADDFGVWLAKSAHTSAGSPIWALHCHRHAQDPDIPVLDRDRRNALGRCRDYRSRHSGRRTLAACDQGRLCRSIRPSH